MQDAYSPYTHPEYEVVDNGNSDEMIPHFTSDVDIIDPRRAPQYIQALGIRPGMPLDELSARTSLMTSYMGVPTEDLSLFINGHIRIIGCMIYHVDYFTSKATGQRTPGYDVVLLKLEDTVTDRVTGEVRHAVVSCNAKQVFELARNVWIPFIGWYDWQGVLEYRVTKDDKGYHLREVLKQSTTVSPQP